MAELIEGSVPDSFNTNTGGEKTGNTKLRVYSSGGNAHSGTVELPVTLTNNTASSKTFEQSYVFFAGHRQVGAYTPKPVYDLALTGVNYSHYDDIYAVTTNGQNCTVTAPTTVSGLTALSATVKANTGYSLPSSVTVKVNGSTLAQVYLSGRQDYDTGRLCQGRGRYHGSRRTEHLHLVLQYKILGRRQSQKSDRDLQQYIRRAARAHPQRLYP